ncbi:chorismate synthase [Clostridium manihotivorum]|uniref:Chorismate synthase n=1 Tax=Clostridium manihotivorum TaxID=2320868 RepID=A0A3R5UAU3_9CLOT|nr:chorismate synthase [Clostridium manihotivorum]QAA33962.1 chorismate synthase [Clostridium manihotivorum]
MSGVWGSNIKLSIFGESHGGAIGINISGLPVGKDINEEEIYKEMQRRAPGRSNLATARKEEDRVEILSGVFNGKTTGAPLCGIIRNNDTRSKDYSKLKDVMRPSHSDYPASVKYKGFNDYRGGGHFSGRITAPLVFAGAIAKSILREKGINIGAHIKSIADIEDDDFNPIYIDNTVLDTLKEKDLPIIDDNKKALMEHRILSAKMEGDSVGGVIQCAITGVEVGVGDPFFDSLESTIAHLAFSVPAVKGIEFGKGFELSKLKGSEANDSYYYEGEKIATKTNNNGGILGGLTNGMPVLFNVAIKPTASIIKYQDTVDIDKKEDTKLQIEGRHDPCIVTRAVVVIEAIAALAILDLMEGEF